jgi:hypothetical protein
MLIAFEGTTAAIDIPDCPHFRAALDAATSGWSNVPVSDAAQMVASVEKLGDDLYRITGPDGAEADVPAASAACGVMVDVVEWMIDERPAELFLHCGAVEFNGRLVIFPSRSRAGKSTLVTRLAAGGHRIFGDDILRLDADDQTGIAIGIPPRVRLPLPVRASAGFRSFVEGATTAADDRYAFVEPPVLAPRGTGAPLGAIVLLDRRESGPAALGRPLAGDILRTLVSQNFALGETASRLLLRLHRMMQALPGFVLRYSDLEDAVALLEKTFAKWPVDTRPASVFALENDAVENFAGERDTVPFDASGHHRQAAGIELRQVDDEIFLAEPETAAIHFLNPSGAALWNLLAEPVSAGEAASLLIEAFPEADAAMVAADVEALFSSLAAAGFIEPVAKTQAASPS